MKVEIGFFVVVEKQSLRTNFRKHHQELPADDKKAQSELILHRLLPFLKDQSGLWGIYWPQSDEPSLLALMDQASHLKFAFPRVLSKSLMAFFQVESLSDLSLGSYGLQEPDGDPKGEVVKEGIAGIVIPGLAFDQDGVRLGWGGGYYDRFLENFKGLKLGVTFRQGILSDETLPRESHDQLMNIIVSPDHWIDLR